jgi:predicted PurR-regulated permease PerM
MGNKQVNRKFGLTVGLALIVIFLYQLIFKHQPLVYTVVIGGLLTFIALIMPQLLEPLRKVWDKVGEVLGFINTHIILFVVFFLVLTPLCFILRILKRNLIKLKFKNDNSYWQKAELTEAGSYKQQF